MKTYLSRLVRDAEPPGLRAVDVEPHRSADRLARSAPPEPFFSPVVIRMATAADRPALERLAQLDSGEPPEGQTLIGEVQGHAVVAVGLADGSSIADPFVAAGPILELVLLRARHLRPESRAGGIRSLRRQRRNVRGEP